MDLIFKMMDGTEYNTKDYELKVIDLVVGTPKVISQRDYIEGNDGFIDYGTDFGERPIKASFLMSSIDRLDTVLLRHDIFKFVLTKEPFYLIDNREPNKRWLAQVVSDFDFRQETSTIGRFEIPLIAQPYAESVGTTMDPFTFDSELWGVGMNLPADLDLEYTHTTTTFDVYNASDRKINPRKTPLEITFTNTGAAFTGLAITNNTTGDVWQYNGTVNTNDVIKLDGVRSLKNDVSVFPDTNRKLISLDKGMNSFSVSGSSSHTIQFNFRFYYL